MFVNSVYAYNFILTVHCSKVLVQLKLSLVIVILFAQVVNDAGTSTDPGATFTPLYLTAKPAAGVAVHFAVGAPVLSAWRRAKPQQSVGRAGPGDRCR